MMTNPINDPNCGMSPAELEAALNAIIQEVGGHYPTTDGWAAIREGAAANLSPAELAETQAAVRDELRSLFGMTATDRAGGSESTNDERRRVAGLGGGHPAGG